MAWGPELTNPVLLGYLDSGMEEDHCNFTTSKVGGLPDWACLPPVNSPICGICKSTLVQVVQIYAPLSGSPFHRTLHIFACLQPPCWNQISSWCCLRSQQRDKPTFKLESQPVSQATDWLGDADDWGDEDNDDTNGNYSQVSPATTSTPSPVGAVGGIIQTPGNYLNLNLQESVDSLAINNLTLIEGDTNRNDGNANISPPCRGASAPNVNKIGGHICHGEVEMEGDDEECVALEEIKRPITDIPTLFYSKNRAVPTTGIKIEPFYIWVEEESIFQEGSGQHEQNLLMEYKAREAMEQVSENRPQRQGGDSYEKAVPSHGDEYFHKLVTVIQQNPGQVLRYNRLSGSLPLLLRPLQETPSLCRHCNAKLTFELQLLPSMVGQLKVFGLEGAPVEWGTVLVYTCLASCWEEESGPRTEEVLVQAETM